MSLRLFAAKEYSEKEILCNKDRMPEYKPHKKIKLPEELLNKIRKKLIGEYRSVKFYTVNGEILRDMVDLDWVLGGGPARYAYIPDFPSAEIWVEAEGMEDILDVFVHELTETIQMVVNKKNYDKAHDFANGFEIYARRHHRLRTFRDFTEFIDEHYLGGGKFKPLPSA